MTAAEAQFLNREHRVSWRNGQLTTKSSWVGSLTGTQVFATVEKNVRSSGKYVAFGACKVLLNVTQDEQLKPDPKCSLSLIE